MLIICQINNGDIKPWRFIGNLYFNSWNFKYSKYTLKKKLNHRLLMTETLNSFTRQYDVQYLITIAKDTEISTLLCHSVGNWHFASLIKVIYILWHKLKRTLYMYWFCIKLQWSELKACRIVRIHKKCT